MNIQASARAAEHYRVLREDGMRIEAPWLATLRLTGPDTRAFLQGLATQDLEAATPGQAATTFFTTEKGRPLALAWVQFDADGNAWIVADESEPGALLRHFDRFRVMEEVEFALVPQSTLVYAGHDRDRLLERVPGVAIHGTPLSFAVAPHTTDPSPSADPSAAEAWRLGIGLPRAGIDFGLDRLVTELREPEAISSTKGCYVGQEVVARTSQRGQVRRERFGFSFEWLGEGPDRGAEVRADGRAAGFVTSAAPEPGSSRGFGMGYRSTEPELRELPLVLVQGAATSPVDARPWPLWP